MLFLFLARDDVLDQDDVYVFGGLGPDGPAIRIPFPQISRNRNADVYTQQAHKDYRPCYHKGRIRPGMETLPFGYRLEQHQPQHQDVDESPSENDESSPADESSGHQEAMDDIPMDLPGHSNWTPNDYRQNYGL